MNEIYFQNKDKITTYLTNKFSHNYSRDVLNNLDKIFNLYKAQTVIDIKKLIQKKKVNERGGKTAYRVYLNFIEEFDLIDEYIIERLRKKIKLNINSNIDTYIPSKNEVNITLKFLLENYGKEYSILYNMFIESGCRPVEMQHFLENYDENKVEISNNVVTYNNFYLRNSKNSYYLFYTKDTFNEFKNNYSKIKKISFSKFREDIVRNKEIVNLKYLRKYNFTCLIKSGVNFEIADFIQGRSSKSVGFNHYLAKKEIAVKEYEKLKVF